MIKNALSKYCTGIIAQNMRFNLQQINSNREIPMGDSLLPILSAKMVTLIAFDHDMWIRRLYTVRDKSHAICCIQLW